jgi:hypothetical protein
MEVDEQAKHHHHLLESGSAKEKQAGCGDAG